MTTNRWKLRDAKARFSEVVRRARAGRPQQVTVRGKDAVTIVDSERFEIRPIEIRPKSREEPTLAGFVERSKKYRGAGLDVRRVKVQWIWHDARRNDRRP
jgi:prevent-host-death family protein